MSRNKADYNNMSLDKDAVIDKLKALSQAKSDDEIRQASEGLIASHKSLNVTPADIGVDVVKQAEKAFYKIFRKKEKQLKLKEIEAQLESNTLGDNNTQIKALRGELSKDEALLRELKAFSSKLDHEIERLTQELSHGSLDKVHNYILELGNIYDKQPRGQYRHALFRAFYCTTEKQRQVISGHFNSMLDGQNQKHSVLSSGNSDKVYHVINSFKVLNEWKYASFYRDEYDVAVGKEASKRLVSIKREDIYCPHEFMKQLAQVLGSSVQSDELKAYYLDNPSAMNPLSPYSPDEWNYESGKGRVDFPLAIQIEDGDTKAIATRMFLHTPDKLFDKLINSEYTEKLTQYFSKPVFDAIVATRKLIKVLTDYLTDSQKTSDTYLYDYIKPLFQDIFESRLDELLGLFQNNSQMLSACDPLKLQKVVFHIVKITNRKFTASAIVDKTADILHKYIALNPLGNSFRKASIYKLLNKSESKALKEAFVSKGGDQKINMPLTDKVSRQDVGSVWKSNSKDFDYFKTVEKISVLYDVRAQTDEKQKRYQQSINSATDLNHELRFKLKHIKAELEYRKKLYELRGAKPQKALWPWSIDNKLLATNQMIDHVAYLIAGINGQQGLKAVNLPDTLASHDGSLSLILKDLSPVSRHAKALFNAEKWLQADNADSFISPLTLSAYEKPNYQVIYHFLLEIQKRGSYAASVKNTDFFKNLKALNTSPSRFTISFKCHQDFVLYILEQLFPVDAKILPANTQQEKIYNILFLQNLFQQALGNDSLKHAVTISRDFTNFQLKEARSRADLQVIDVLIGQGVQRSEIHRKLFGKKSSECASDSEGSVSSSVESGSASNVSDHTVTQQIVDSRQSQSPVNRHANTLQHDNGDEDSEVILNSFDTRRRMSFVSNWIDLSPGDSDDVTAVRSLRDGDGLVELRAKIISCLDVKLMEGHSGRQTFFAQSYHTTCKIWHDIVYCRTVKDLESYLTGSKHPLVTRKLSQALELIAAHEKQSESLVQLPACSSSAPKE